MRTQSTYRLENFSIQEIEEKVVFQYKLLISWFLANVNKAGLFQGGFF